MIFIGDYKFLVGVVIKGKRSIRLEQGVRQGLGFVGQERLGFYLKSNGDLLNILSGRGLYVEKIIQVEEQRVDYKSYKGVDIQVDQLRDYFQNLYNR